MTNESLKVNGEHVKCPSCAAEMVFSPEEELLVCPYCGTHQEIAAGNDPIEEHNFEFCQTGSGEWGVATKIIHCDNCGADMVADTNVTARVCAYCGSPMLTQAENPDNVSPEAVLPFKIAADTAKLYFKEWVKRRFFAPRALRDASSLQRLNGVYIPHFTYDCNTRSDYHAQAGTHYYETEMVTVQRDGKTITEPRQIMKTRWTPVSGNFSSSFDDVLVLASENVDSKLVSLEFDLNDLVPYQKEYIYSFLAENNSISKEACWNTAQNIIKTKLEMEITKTIAADEIRSLSFTTDYRNITFKSIFLPVWISSYQFKGKTYKFMINGQSGEINGQAPFSALRVSLSMIGSILLSALFFALNPILGIFAIIGCTALLLNLGSGKSKMKLPEGKQKKK